jgi:hypothetical protein
MFPPQVVVRQTKEAQRKRQHAVAKKNSLPLNKSSSFDVVPLQLVINPNAESLMDRPVVALTVAILTNTDVDLNLTSDHRIRHASLGLEDGSGVVVGDSAIARYLAHRRSTTTSNTTCCLYGEDASTQALQNAWMDYAQSLTQLSEDQRRKARALP